MKNILLISEYFAPISSIASIRFTKIIKYLARTGKYHFYVISSKNGYAKDAILEKDLHSVSEFVDVEYIDIMDNPIDSFRRRKQKSRGQSENIDQSDSSSIQRPNNSDIRYKPYKECTAKEKISKYIISLKYIYNEHVFKKAGYRKALAFNAHFDCIISSYGDAGTHLLARKLQKHFHNIPWIADFRDSAVSFYRPTVFNPYFKRINRLAIKHASVLTGVTDSALGECMNSDKAHIVINGFDREDYASYPKTTINRDESKFHICYTGKIYYGKSKANVLFKALKELIDDNLISNVVIDYAGLDAEMLQEQANEYDLSSIIIDHGYISREEVLQIQKNSQLLLVLSWNDKDGKNVLTGKFMEYLMSGINVFAIVSGDIPDSIVSSIINQTKVGYCYEEANKHSSIENVKDYLLRMYQQWNEHGVCEYHGIIREIEKYSYEHISSEYDNYIQDAIKGGQL